MPDAAANSHRRLTHRALPALAALALLAALGGAIVGSRGESEGVRTADAFGRAWERGDFAAMRSLLAPRRRSRWSAAALRRAYERAAATATATGVRVGDPAGADGDRVRLPVAVRTRVFGTVGGDVLLPVRDGGVDWTPALVFPGLSAAGGLRRHSRPPRRAAIVSRDGKVLATGVARRRSSPLGPLAASIAGEVRATRDARERAALYARGFPADWPVGENGLERAFERELAGTPGGELLAGGRVIARARPRAARPVRTTIDTRLQRVAISALGPHFGGVPPLQARGAEVPALAVVAFSAPQPPGSTFKLVTATAALEARLVRPSTRFPVQTGAVIDGVPLENANGEACGGSFYDSFVHSCNSVFAPLGVRLGARRLVAVAERYGFNEPPGIPGARPGTLPPAAEIRTPLELGATAIGQGKVLATPLGLASMAQTVAAGGVRTRPTLRAGLRRRERIRVTTRRVARTLERFMVGVVASGTGTAAAIPGVRVAGKTGTAELRDTRGPNAAGSDPSSTDAWFAAFAPARRPRIAVAVMLVGAGAGGETAAPVARVVLAAGAG